MVGRKRTLIKIYSHMHSAIDCSDQDIFTRPLDCAVIRGLVCTCTAVPLYPTAHSSMKDSRFQPISWEEVPKLECGVSLLTNFERAVDYMDWEVRPLA